MDASRIILHLELDPEHTPVSGAIGLDDGERLPFVGWLGLAEALDRVLTRERGPLGIEDGPQPDRN